MQGITADYETFFHLLAYINMYKERMGIAMSSANFRINLSPDRALALVREQQDADLVHEELHELDGGKWIGTLIFERYYFRTSSRAALIVIIDNIQGATDVRVIGTGSSEGLLFNFDWGASDNFVQSVMDILSDYIVG